MLGQSLQYRELTLYQDNLISAQDWIKWSLTFRSKLVKLDPCMSKEPKALIPLLENGLVACIYFKIILNAVETI